MNYDLGQILKSIDHQVQGVVWLSPLPLTAELPAFHELNFLFNGLLSKKIKSDHFLNKDKTQLFWANHYGNKFFLLFIHTENSDDLKLAHLIDVFYQEKIKAILINQSKFQFHHNEIEIIPFKELQPDN